MWTCVESAVDFSALWFVLPGSHTKWLAEAVLLIVSLYEVHCKRNILFARGNLMFSKGESENLRCWCQPSDITEVVYAARLTEPYTQRVASSWIQKTLERQIWSCCQPLYQYGWVKFHLSIFTQRSLIAIFPLIDTLLVNKRHWLIKDVDQEMLACLGNTLSYRCLVTPQGAVQSAMMSQQEFTFTWINWRPVEKKGKPLGKLFHLFCVLLQLFFFVL